MALSSFFLASGSKKITIDAELNSLFKITPGPELPSRTSSSGRLKRKNHDILSVPPETSAKKTRVQNTDSSSDQGKKTHPDARKAKQKKKPAKRSNAAAENTDDSNEGIDDQSDDDDDSALENAYLSKVIEGKGQSKDLTLKYNDENEGAETEGEDDVEDASSSENDDEDRSPPQHESLTKKQRSKKLPKAMSKYAPPDETLEQRNARTIFIGNLSVEVSQKRSLLKSLQRHILSLIPASSDSSNAMPKVESTRFRSIPFAVPTSTPEKDDETPSAQKSKSKSTSKSRQHDIERTKSWKVSSSSGNKEQIDATKGEKQFLTPAQKKKIAFINQEIHASGSSINAYIVFAHPIPASVSGEVSNRKSNLPPLPEVMNPYEAARLAKEACDGSEFMDRTLRVDIVAQNAGLNLPEAQGMVLRTGSDVDPKRCIFVGNLDFESKEEDVRAYFEGVVSAEKGPKVGKDSENDYDGNSGSDDDEGDSGKKGSLKVRGRSQGWVTRVRIIRDKDTQLGKGFAYIQFAERDCVDEILAAALEPGKLKFAKRKLRVERCKTIPGGSFKIKVRTDSPLSLRLNNHPSKSNRSTLTSVSIPKGDPSLGAKLAHLSKEDRKSAKAADADRMARRLAKKKSRIAMAVGSGIKIQGNQRERVRKLRSDGAVLGKKGKGHGVGSAAKNTGKAISERSLKKRNAKK